MQKKQRRKKLPDKPSALIRLALKDLEATRKDRRYRISMSYWHVPYDVADSTKHGSGRKCTVCLAGAVLAKSLCAPIEDDVDLIHPFDGLGNLIDCLKEGDNEKLLALDSFRRGHIADGLGQMGLLNENPQFMHSVSSDVPSYTEDRKGFLAAMEKMAKELKTVGL